MIRDRLLNTVKIAEWINAQVHDSMSVVEHTERQQRLDG
jgi:hypothetical protein